MDLILLLENSKDTAHSHMREKLWGKQTDEVGKISEARFHWSYLASVIQGALNFPSEMRET